MKVVGDMSIVVILSDKAFGRVLTIWYLAPEFWLSWFVGSLVPIQILGIPESARAYCTFIWSVFVMTMYTADVFPSCSVRITQIDSV